MATKRFHLSKQVKRKKPKNLQMELGLFSRIKVQKSRLEEKTYYLLSIHFL